ncbi:T4 family baseplate hub assembly chaperone [Grimontia sp. NTOU-MAR1]|uniref:T4 family baseplate hub assembly chaperone n=1 Tax=Grimontia sp. NTOU-MAR1 TaxID=3111011 RepID=UPI002DB788B9|nr:hypothetical protein [Grimontia sp. NTOU-MAR1]WRV99797.1 hypothetical protein VP504_22685 [Grimontia sp. NTOU-MAR1]
MAMVLQALNDNRQVEVWEAASARRAQERAAILAGAFVPDSLKPTLPDWTVAGRDHLLMLAYQRQFGDAIEVEAKCDECGEKTQLSFTVSQVLGTASPELSKAWDAVHASLDTDAYLPVYHNVIFEGIPCRFRLPRIADLNMLENSEVMLFQFAQRVIEPEDFPRIRSALADKENAQEAWEMLFEQIEQQMLDSEPLSIVSLNSACPDCGAETLHQFDIANQFWAQLSASVEKQLWDVHLLATAYGWSSQDILAMSPARRRRHIAMIIE